MRKAPPSRARAAPLRVDPEKYPNVSTNPGLERALRIRQALDQGRPRDEAVRLADEAMGRAPAKPAAVRPKRGGALGKAVAHARGPAHAAKRQR
jgi:hypothetical protein